MRKDAARNGRERSDAAPAAGGVCGSKPSAVRLLQHSICAPRRGKHWMGWMDGRTREGTHAMNWVSSLNKADMRRVSKSSQAKNAAGGSSPHTLAPAPKPQPPLPPAGLQGPTPPAPAALREGRNPPPLRPASPPFTPNTKPRRPAGPRCAVDPPHVSPTASCTTAWMSRTP